MRFMFLSMADTRHGLRALAVAGLALGLAGCSTVENLFGSSGPRERIAGDRISILELEQKLEADPQIADLPVNLPPSVMNVSWAQPGGTPTNMVGHVKADGPLREVWRANAGRGSSGRSRITAPPVVADGRVYVLDAGANVSAFDSETGQRVWRRTLTPDSRSWDEGYGGGAAYDNGTVYVSSGFGFVVALDAATGEEKWRQSLGAPLRSAPTVYQGRIFVNSIDNHMHALSTDNGLVLWSYRALEEPAGILLASSPAVDRDVVIAPFTSGELVALRSSNGQMVWADSLTRGSRFTALASINDIAGRPVIHDGLVIGVSHSGRMAAIDMRTGERIWTRDIASIQTPWVAGEFIYIVSTDSELICLSARDGRVRWITQLKRWRNERSRTGRVTWAGPILASERLVLFSSERDAAVVSPYTGEIEREFRVRGPVMVQPVAAMETVFVLTEDADLIALR